jgi:ADP-ribose pyrophosphatase
LNLEEKSIAREYKFKGKIVNVRVDTVILPNGKSSFREVVEHPGAVAIVPIDSGENVFFVRQFRKACEKTILEVPAGKLEAGENPIDCACRELQEEIGMFPHKLDLLSVFYTSPGFSNELIYLYLARELQSFSIEKLDDEFLRIVKIPFARAVEKSINGEFEDAKTLVGLLLARSRLQ